MTKNVLDDAKLPPMARVQMSQIVGEYVQAQARSSSTPEAVTVETKAFMGEIEKNSKARGARGQIVLVGEAVLTENVPDITNELRAEIYKKVKRPEVAAAQNDVMGSMRAVMADPRRLRWPAVVEGPVDQAIDRRRYWRCWAAIGLLAVGWAGHSALASWGDEHGLLINVSELLPNWAFFVEKSAAPKRGDYVVFDPPKTKLVVGHFGAKPWQLPSLSSSMALQAMLSSGVDLRLS